MNRPARHLTVVADRPWADWTEPALDLGPVDLVLILTEAPAAAATATAEPVEQPTLF